MRAVRPKFLVALAVAILLALAASDVMADAAEARQQIKLMFTEDATAAHAVCAAWGGLISTQVSGALQKVIQQEAQRHYNEVLKVFSKELTDKAVTQIMEDAQKSYNMGRITWGELNDAASACAVY